MKIRILIRAATLLALFVAIFSSSVAVAWTNSSKWTVSPETTKHSETDNTLDTTPVPDSTIAAQRAALLKNALIPNYGPQSPRDIDYPRGNNPLIFSAAPAYQQMNLCNIHFHKGAEHKSRNYSTYIGNGDGKGYGSGYALKKNTDNGNGGSEACGKKEDGKHRSVKVGDTIEVHFVYTTAPAKPGYSLASCYPKTIVSTNMEGSSDYGNVIVNPQLRVEARVFYLEEKGNGFNFMDITKLDVKNGLHQANHQSFDKELVQYAGSTTGPSFNKVASPHQVTWSVSKSVWGLDIETLDQWCKGNDFKEDHAHGVRNLVTDTRLLSTIK